MTADELNEAKYLLERRRFAFDRAKVKREHRFTFRNSAALITAALSMAALCLSGASGYNSYQESRRTEIREAATTEQARFREQQATERAQLEAVRKANFELLQYMTVNYDLIYSRESAKQVRIRNAMRHAFPQATIQTLFADLAKTAPTLDGPNVWQERERLDDQSLIGSTSACETCATAQGPRFRDQIAELLGPKRRAVSDELVRSYVGNEKALVGELVDSLLPQASSSSYRQNLYIVYTLARIPSEWRATADQIRRIAALRSTGNYKDPTFARWVDLALSRARRAEA